jgi:dTDP-glucose 4,6-dehydratase
MAENPLNADLDHILGQCDNLWPQLHNSRIFITGGTGFFGTWILESIAWANDRKHLGITPTILTRNPQTFRAKAPHLADRPDFHFIQGDVRDFPFPSGPFTHIIHAATEASVRLVEEDPLQMFDTIVTGTRRTLDFARHSGARQFLLTSSGAIYGPQPATITHLPEDYTGGPDPAASHSAYAEGKRAAETLAASHAQKTGTQIKLARCFAFIGPYLPLDGHFAAGNFIRDALQGNPIHIAGDGTPHRSYLYAADLITWLWHILLRGTPGRPYNVGSEHSLSITQLAHMVSNCFTPTPEVRTAKTPDPSRPITRYVPSTQRARTELGLTQTIETCAAIQKTILWHTQKHPHPSPQ